MWEPVDRIWSKTDANIFPSVYYPTSFFSLLALVCNYTNYFVPWLNYLICFITRDFLKWVHLHDMHRLQSIAYTGHKYFDLKRNKNLYRGKLGKFRNRALSFVGVRDRSEILCSIRWKKRKEKEKERKDCRERKRGRNVF